MKASPKQFKRPPKKYQPKGLSILYEDRDILVVDKACGLLTVNLGKVREQSALAILNDYVRKGNAKDRHRVMTVHRLDRDTSGVLMFAKTADAKRYIIDEWKNFQKTYHAIVRGTLPKKQGLITSYLAEDHTHKMYSVTDPKAGVLARTDYKVLKESSRYSLLELGLLTGKKNQIRVHLADLGFPVAGDMKYGVKDRGINRLMLHASSLTFTHPYSKEKMTCTAELPREFESLMGRTYRRS